MKNIFWVVVIVLGGLFLFGDHSNDSIPGSTSYDYSYGDDYEEPITSENWECTDDCSGHDAGYEWASENGITNPYDCDGNSDSFIEGCEAYANEYQMEEEEYDEYDDYGY